MANQNSPYMIQHCIFYFDIVEVDYVSFADKIDISEIGKPHSMLGDGIEFVQFVENNNENKPMSGKFFLDWGNYPDVKIYDINTIRNKDKMMRQYGSLEDNNKDFKKREKLREWMKENSIELLIRTNRDHYYVFDKEKDVVLGRGDNFQWQVQKMSWGLNAP